MIGSLSSCRLEEVDYITSKLSVYLVGSSSTNCLWTKSVTKADWPNVLFHQMLYHMVVLNKSVQNFWSMNSLVYISHLGDI